MSVGTHLDMHCEHQRWLSDVLFWAEEADLWRKRNRKAADDLGRLAGRLKQYADEIGGHLAELIAHARHVEAHEHALAAFEGGHGGEDLLPLAKEHREEATRHERQRHAHAEIKARHHLLMAEWSRLLEEVARLELK
jgi:hypothetical protein